MTLDERMDHGSDTAFHVALVTPWKTKGGVSSYSQRLADALEQRGVTVTPVPVSRPNTSNPASFARLADRVPAAADIVHVQFEAGVFGRVGMSGVWAPLVFGRLAVDDRPVVTTLHEVFENHPEAGRAGGAMLQARDYALERLALLASDAVFVHTRAAERTLRERHGTDTCIERSLHPVEVDASPRDASEAKSDLDVTEPVWLTFGWVEAKKHYEDVVAALPQHPDATYLIAGEPRTDRDREMLDDVLETARSLGVADRVRHVGYVPDEDVPTVFSAADVVVLPYDRVTQSGVVNLALAYERPVVASELPSFEELRDRFGCLATYDDAAELAELLGRIESEDEYRADLVSKAAEYARTVTWNRFATHTVSLYDCVTR